MREEAEVRRWPLWAAPSTEAVVGRVTGERQLLVDLATAAGIPTFFSTQAFVEIGGLAAPGFDAAGLNRRNAAYVVKILEGAAPFELPVEQNNTYNLSINLLAAADLGIEFPPNIIALADVVIE